MEDDGEYDDLFYEADTVNPMDRVDISLPTPPPPPPPPPKHKLPLPKKTRPPLSEKEKWAEASRVAKRQRSQEEQEATVIPQQHVANEQEDDVFPHPDDQRRLENYIYMCTLSIVMTGKMGGTFDHTKCSTMTDIDVVGEDVNALFRRFRKLRRSLHAGMCSMVERSGNAVLLGIVQCMDNSKLTVYSKPKYLHSEAEVEGSGAGTAYDVWTLQRIPAEANVRGASLTPVSGTVSQPKPPPPEFMQRGPIMFHVDAEYVSVLKCLYTLLFFLDFLNSEINTKIEAVIKTMPPEHAVIGQWNADIHHAWDTLFARDTESRALIASSSSSRKNAGVSSKDIAKLYPMHVFVESMQKQLLTCCSAMQKIVGSDPFIIREKRGGGN